MRRVFLLVLFMPLLFSGCKEQEERLFTIGMFQVTDAPTLNEVGRGCIQALGDQGYQDGVNIRLRIRNGMGDISEVQKIAQEFVDERVDIIVALSTQCLQAALIATHKIPVVFSSVANPYLAGAGRSAENHLGHVTGVASTGPIKQNLVFIKEVLPRIKRVGTLWTPSEINSKYYLDIAQEGAAELGLELVSVPVANAGEVLLSAQVLVNKNIDAIYQISDNTINSAFEALGRVAEENSIPLFGGSLLSVYSGAGAAMGWDFFEMGYKTGEIVARVMKGESPARIPFHHMTNVKLYLNLRAAGKQGFLFPEHVIRRADRIVDEDEKGGLTSRT